MMEVPPSSGARGARSRASPVLGYLDEQSVSTLPAEAPVYPSNPIRVNNIVYEESEIDEDNMSLAATPDSPSGNDFIRYVIVCQCARRRIMAKKKSAKRRFMANERHESLSQASIRVQSIGRMAQAVATAQRRAQERDTRNAILLQSAARSFVSRRRTAILRQQDNESRQRRQAEEEAPLRETVTVERLPRGGATTITNHDGGGGHHHDRRRQGPIAFLRRLGGHQNNASSSSSRQSPSPPPQQPNSIDMAPSDDGVEDQQASPRTRGRAAAAAQARYIEAEVVAMAQPLPPLVDVDMVTSLRISDNVRDSISQLPCAEAVLQDTNVNTIEPSAALQRYLSRTEQVQATAVAQPEDRSSGGRRYASPPPPSSAPPALAVSALRQSTESVMRFFSTPGDSSPQEAHAAAAGTQEDSITHGAVPPPPPPPPRNRRSSQRQESSALVVSRAPTQARIVQLAQVAAHGSTVEARRGALDMIATEASMQGNAAALLALVRPLYDTDVEVRVAAVRAAWKLGSLELVQFALDDEAVPVRRVVLEALASTETPWTRCIQCDDPVNEQGVRLSALVVALMKALEDVSLDDGSLCRAVDRLQAALLESGVTDGALLSAPFEKAMQAQRTERVRRSVVRRAGELGGVDPLRRIAIFDAVPAVRRDAVVLLGWNGRSREIKELVLLGHRDDDAGVRAEALEWLARLDDVDGLGTAGLLEDRSAELRARAAELLGDAVSRRVTGIAPRPPDTSQLPIRMPEAPRPAPQQLDRTAAARSRNDPMTGYDNALRRLAEAQCRDTHVGVRGAAAQQLARLRAVTRLAEGLNDSSAAHRRKVVTLLGTLGDTDCLAPLKLALGNDSDGNVRSTALDALGRLEDPEAAIDVIATKDTDVKNREKAADWLGTLRRADALLDVSLTDTAPSVRVLAARNLRELFVRCYSDDTNTSRSGLTFSNVSSKNPAAFRSALLIKLGDPERSVRVEAAAALYALRERHWADIVRGDDNDCRRLANVNGSKATAVLVFILCNASVAQDRVRAAEALGERGEPLELLALNALCACVSETQLPATLRVAALKALEKLLREDDELIVDDVVIETRVRRPTSNPRELLPSDFYDRLDLSLRKALDDNDNADVRVHAVRVVGAARCEGHALEKLLVLAAPVNEKLAPHNAKPPHAFNQGSEPSSDVRAAAAKNLGRFASSRDAALAVLDALSDRDVTTRDNAATSFASYQGASFADQLARAGVSKFKQFLKPPIPRSTPSGSTDEKNQLMAQLGNIAALVRAATARALGNLLRSTSITLPTLHDAVKSDRDAMVRAAAAAACGVLRNPQSLKPLYTAFKDKRQPNLAQIAVHSLGALNYSPFCDSSRNEQVIMQAPVLKTTKKIFSTLKALVLTDAPRLFYIDATDFKAKNCELDTLTEDDSSSAARRTNRNLSFVVPGQGRVVVTLLFTHAADWLSAREQALSTAALRPPPSSNPTGNTYGRSTSGSPTSGTGNSGKKFFRTSSSASGNGSPTSSQGGSRRPTLNRDPSDNSLPPSAFSSPVNSREGPPPVANTPSSRPTRREPVRRWSSN